MSTKKYSVVLILGIFALIGCKKNKKITGCTDSSASNYDALAEISNNQCLYSSEIHFWLKQNTWSGYGNDTLHLFQGSNEIGIVTSSAVFLAAPYCINTGVCVYSVQSNSSNTLNYSVKTEAGVEVSTGAITLSKAECIIEEIQ